MCAYYVYRTYRYEGLHKAKRNKQLNWAAPQNKRIAYWGLIVITQQDGDSSSCAEALQLRQSASTKGNMRTYMVLLFIWHIHFIYIQFRNPSCYIRHNIAIHSTQP